ncbi:MAG: hypothetical protein U0132_16880 [Gemmatimonadaceae bacterium]
MRRPNASYALASQIGPLTVALDSHVAAMLVTKPFNMAAGIIAEEC